MLLNCGVGEDSWESLEQQGDPITLSWRKSVLNIRWKDWCWSWNFNTLATWCEELTHWERPWCWKWLKEGGEGDNRGWDGWRASLSWWTWIEYAPGVGDGQWSMEDLCAAVHGVAQSRTPLSDWTELNPKRNVSTEVYNCKIWGWGTQREKKKFKHKSCP